MRYKIYKIFFSIIEQCVSYLYPYDSFTFPSSRPPSLVRPCKEDVQNEGVDIVLAGL